MAKTQIGFSSNLSLFVLKKYEYLGWMNRIALLFFLISSISFAQQSRGYQVRPSNVPVGKLYKSNMVIENVPSYIWHRGCGPTALGMVLGYYNLNGFSELFPGNELTQTNEVNLLIASEEHYSNYALPLDYFPDLMSDQSELGVPHENNSIADFMQTSFSILGNYWGWSWSNDISTAFVDYVAYRNPDYITETDYAYFSNTSWEEYKVEIDNNRPVIVLVDTDGDDFTDHFVVGIGYNDDGQEYGVYDTWDQLIHWYSWQGMSEGVNYGVFGFNKFGIAQGAGLNNLQGELKKRVKTLDMMGRETNFKPNTPLIYVYDDGSTEVVFSVGH